MTTFDKREEGFEKKFAHDEELRFKANARRNKLLGLWAAEKMGLTGPAADAYAKEVVVADFEEAGDDDVFRKVRKDFDAKGVAQSDQEIRKTMVDLMARPSSRSRRAIDSRRGWRGAAASAGTADFAHGFRLMANLAGYSLARRLAAGETVYTGWCALPAPIVAETIAREGFVAVTIDQQHGLWDTAATAVAIAAIRAVRLRAGRARAARRLRDRQPLARLRRRRHHRADDQHGRRRQGLRQRDEVSAARRAELGADAGDDARRHFRSETIFERGQCGDGDAGHDRDQDRDGQSRRDRGRARDRRAVRRPLRSVDRADRRQGTRSALRYRRGGARQDRRGVPQGRQDRRASIAPTPSARWPAPSAASASSRSAAISASCAPAPRRSSRR